MLEQKLTNRRPGPLAGVGVIALIALAAAGGSMFFSLLEPRLGRLASVLFLAYGCAIAGWLMNRYVLGFIYTATDDCLRVCRTYGRRERFMADVWLNRVQAYGAPEEVRRRFPHAPVSRATRRQCDLAPLALAYRDSDKLRVLILQPDEKLRQHLTRRLEGNGRGKRE